MTIAVDLGRKATKQTNMEVLYKMVVAIKTYLYQLILANESGLYEVGADS